MSDDQGSVRRLRRKDRKKTINAGGPLFPAEEETVSEPTLPEAEEADLPAMPDIEPMPPVMTRPETAPQPARRGCGGCLPNLFTLLFFVATTGVLAYYALVATNPYTPLNPFPPFTPLPVIITATFLPPTETLTPKPGPTATFTPLALATEAPIEFVLANNAPIYIPNANEKGCNWSSIAGTVTDARGQAVDSYQVRITGSGVNEVVYSGSSLTYGPGGFELPLNGVPQEQQYLAQLLTPEGEPVSPEYSITTRAACDQNVALLSFLAR
jgi:hypothetical protein